MPYVASLFGKNKLREVAQQISTDQIQDHLAIVKTWRDDYHTGTLKKDKETSREQAYNSDIFIKILGYQEKPATPYTFEPKATTDKKQLPDAVLLYNDASLDIKNIAAVVELKGASIALDKPQQREGNMSPVQQGFKYKTQYRTCPFVVVSNFYEVRLYNDNQLDYELWTLDDLLNPEDDYLKFKTFYTLLHRENLTSAAGPSRTESLLSDLRTDQEAIGKKFYKEYKEARLELLRDVYRQNEYVRTHFNTGIEKAQKIIDRIVFACFAEDVGLLPDNIINRVVASAESSAFGGSLWSFFKIFFEGIDVGSDKLDIPLGYNGGLFAKDAELDALTITDAPLAKVANLSRYDFGNDLSVNILGHIFEQSITDLEEIKSKVNAAQSTDPIEPGGEIGKRKKEGVYYTPDYIVRYIVDNTLGAYLGEHEERLKTKFGLKGDINDRNYAKREQQVYLEYQTVLQGVRVLDPACGSGAFLVYAFDFLLAENTRVDAILGGSLVGTDYYIRDILRNNLFGVDLNEESVEITKLSLWLKTAQRGKKLTALDANIKSGNSLIDAVAAAGQKAFDWKKQFQDVFRSGGFDVIVGNPPYVSANDIKKYSPKSEYDHLKKNYVTAVGAVDLYIYFFEKALNLLKEGGKLSFISPNRYLSASYGRALREWLIANYTIASFVDYASVKVFEDASTYPVISFINKVAPTSAYTLKAGKFDGVSKLPLLLDFDSSKLTILNESILGFLLNDKMELTEKIFDQSDSLREAGAINATSTAKEADEFAPLINTDGGFKLVNTGTIDSYCSLWGIKTLTKQSKQFLTPYLPRDAKLLSKNRFDLYGAPKIIIAKIGLSCESFYDELGEYASIDTNCITAFKQDYAPGYVQSWLGSKLYNYLYECLFDGLRMQGGYLLYSAPNMKNTPIKRIDPADQVVFVNAAARLQVLHQSLRETDQKFRQIIRAGLGIEKLVPKLNRWWTVDFQAFAKLAKTSALTLEQNEQLMELLAKYTASMLVIDNEITQVTRTVDQSFYQLFGLTDNEITDVEKYARVMN